MEIQCGGDATEFGPGVSVRLTGDEVAMAIGAYLVAHGVHVSGPRTVLVNDALCTSGEVWIDPSGFAAANGLRLSGRGSNVGGNARP